VHLAYIWIVCHLSAKNYQNRWKFDTVLTKTNLLSFFGTRCISMAAVHTYGLPVNFICTSSFCAGRVFIQLVESKLLVNSINIISKNCGAYLTSELTSS